MNAHNIDMNISQEDFGVDMRWVKKANLFRRNGIELENCTSHDIADVVVTPLGIDLVGVTMLGSPLGRLASRQRISLFFSSEPKASAKLRFRVTYSNPDGSIAAADVVAQKI